MKPKFTILLMLVLFVSGCGYLTHLQELLAIKRYSDNQDLQHAYVDKQKLEFESLLQAVKSGEVDQYSDQKSFRKKFGDPILVKNVIEDGKKMERWLYRYATKFFNSEKVYLYFDDKGSLLKWEYIEVSKKEKDNE